MWKYIPASVLERGVQEVMVENELREALIRLNPEIEQRPERADASGWLTQAQMGQLFGKDKRTISEHIGNIFRGGELD